MRLGALELLDGRAAEQLDRMPPSDTGHAVWFERRLQRLGLARKLVAEFHADDADLARLGETGLERRRAANLDEVVVRPADRVRADADRHGIIPS